MNTIFFDLDGTLINSQPGILHSLRYALTSLRRDVPPDDELRRVIGPPLRGAMQILLQTEDHTLIEEGVRLYREEYGKNGVFNNSVYDGVPEMLTTLSGRFSLYVVTSKARVYAEKIVAHHGWSSQFVAVYGPELDGRFDSKGDLIAHIMQERGLSAGSVVMVGDRRHDIMAAAANQLASVGVLYGYGTRDELVEAGAGEIVATPGELLALFEARS
jgi:phosphoglycolate phosphatase